MTAAATTGALNARIEALLRQREARGLVWSASARIAYIVTGATVAVFTSATTRDLISTQVLAALGLALSVRALQLAKRQQQLALAGLAGLVFDLVVLGALPLSWFHAVASQNVLAAFLVSLEVPYVVLVLMTINTLPLRPLYPLVVAAVGTIQQLALMALAGLAPRAQLGSDPLAGHLHGEVSPTHLAWKIASIVAMGALLAWLARSARRGVHDAVRLEATRSQSRERNAEIIAQSKVAGFARLVAGAAQEINTPLGVVHASVTNTKLCAQRMVQAVQLARDEALKKDASFARTVEALEDGIRVSSDAVHRINSLLKSLRNLAHVDEAELQQADIHEGLDRALSLIGEDVRGKVKLAKEYAELPHITCRPKELCQVFMTLLTNAFEAIEGQGTLRLTTRAATNQVTVEIADSGRGIAPQDLEEIFETGSPAKPAKGGLRLGLPIAREVIRQHGGSISVRSEPGRGTTFRIQLPLKAEAPAPPQSIPPPPSGRTPSQPPPAR